MTFSSHPLRVSMSPRIRCFLLVATILPIAIPSLHAQITAVQRQRLEADAAMLTQRSRIEREDAQARAMILNIPLRAVLDNGAIIELQRFRDGKPEYFLTDNSVSAATISSDRVRAGGALGLSLSGAGVTLSLWDGGAVRVSHQEFAGRVTQKDNTSSQADHATHVAGTMVAAGVKAAARGMSPDARLLAHDWNNDLGEMTTRAAEGVQVSNHSYGSVSGWINNYRKDGRWAWFGDPADNAPEDRNFGLYDSRAREWDNLVHNAGYFLPVKSAGNDRGEGPSSQPLAHWELVNGGWKLVSDVRGKDGGTEGYDCIASYGNAKNILTVGAVEDIPGGYSTSADVRMSSFSGWGPTDDGRIKPDIVTNGVALYSALKSSNTAYASYSGTSMAAPSASGSLGLILEHQKNLHGGTLLRASTIKGLLLHTADEAGSAPGPDYRFGWGLMNTASVVKLMSNAATGGASHLIREADIASGAVYELQLYSPGRGPMHVTICWTDVPGSPQPGMVDPSNRVLVNDMDLRLVGPDAVEHLPWILDPANPAAPATTGDNIRDNVEQVYVSAPVEGWYTVRVAHKGTLHGGRQMVSIIASVSNAPGLLSPPNALTDLSVTPALQWNAAQGAIGYELTVSEHPDMRSPVITRDDLTATWFDTPKLKKLTRYFWRVRVRDAQGLSDWSDVWNFTTGGTSALPGHAVYLDGNDDLVVVPYRHDFSEIEDNDELTIEAWVRPLGWSTGSFPIIDKRDTGSGAGWQLRLHATNGLEFSAAGTTRISLAPQLGRWYHLAVSYRKSDGKIRFYVDGARRAELDFDGDLIGTGWGPLTVGGVPSGAAGHGVIDELRVWRTARGDAEISAGMYTIYDGTEPGLVALLRFDDARTLQATVQPGGEAAVLAGGAAWLVSDVPIVAPTPPLLQYPAQNGVNVPVQPELLWQPSTGALRYRVQISDRADFSTLVLDARDVTDLRHAAPVLTSESVYWWRANATNPAGTSDWSPSHRFTTAIAPPETPTLVTPRVGVRDLPLLVTLLWDASDRAVRYQAQVSTDSLFSAAFLLDRDDIISPTAEVRDLGNFQKYYWRVRAFNFGGMSSWSDIWSFTTLPAEPEAPVLLTPEDHASGVAANPQFTWSPVESATGYQVQLSEEASFGTTLLDASGVPLTRYAASGLPDATWHYWRVRASNAAGTGPWSAISRFRTVRPVPGTIRLLAPPDGAVDVTERPEFLWEADSLADSYTLQVARDSAFNPLVLDMKNIHANRRISPQSLPNNTQLYWRVSAQNESGSGPLSDVWTFRVIDSLAAPMLISPPDGSTVSADALEFRWHSVPASDGYELEVTGPGSSPGLTQTDTSTVKSLLPGEDYLWRVRAWRGPLAGVWSEQWRFRTETKTDTTTGVTQSAGRFESLALHPGYPNPVVDGSVHFGYTLPHSADVRIELRDLLGRRLALLAHAWEHAGAHHRTFDTEGLTPGQYFIVLRVGGSIRLRPLHIAR
jgi:hypothetical protein